MGDLPSEREFLEQDLEDSFGLVRDQIKFDSVSPIVASETVINAFFALLAASVFILLYIWYAFRRVPKSYRYGVAAILALVHDVIIVIGVFSILGKVLNMEVNSMFIVGVLILAGYSVNDNIVVFDRIRENTIRFPDRALATLVNMSIMDTMGLVMEWGDTPNECSEVHLYRAQLAIEADMAKEAVSILTKERVTDRCAKFQLLAKAYSMSAAKNAKENSEKAYLELFAMGLE